MKNEDLFRALSDVGDDLVVMAEKKRFVSPWRKWGQLAAVIAVVCCAGVLAMPYFPAGCDTTEKASASIESTLQHWDGEKNASMTTESVMPETALEEAEEETAEESPAADALPEKENQQITAVQPLTKIICRGTYFYLEPLSEDMGVPPLGEELGTITGSEDLALFGDRVFTVPYSAWFGNYAVNGEPVTQNVYVQTPVGYRHATTANEKVVSRYTIDDVKTALQEQQLDWLAENFVQSIERNGGVQFEDPQELSSEDLNVLLWASTTMNTGVSVADYWFDDAGNYIVPVSDVRWRLDRFLDEYSYDPTQTENYDPALDALVYATEKISYEPVAVTVEDAQVLEGDRLLLLISLPDQGGITKEYTIRFDGDSWRYESIRQIEAD